jgi:hypothetical protein
MIEKKQYVKPQVEQVSLVPTEAVLGGCKTSTTQNARNTTDDIYGCSTVSCVSDANS